MDKIKHSKFLKKEFCKAPYYLLALKRYYENKLNYLTDSEEDKAIRAYFEELFLEFNFSMNRIIPTYEMNPLEIPLLGICNLNCKGCDAYAPLCKEAQDIYLPEDILEDLKTLEVKGFRIREISFEGGEPFLYPFLLEVLTPVRDLFPDTALSILTNGTLLEKKENSFYKNLASLNCFLVVDKYFDIPNFEETIKRIKDLGVHVELDGCTDQGGWFHRAPLNLREETPLPDEDARHFVQCEKANNIFTLSRGILYTCGRGWPIRYFNNFFKKHLPEEGIDIKKCDGEEISKKLASPTNLCKYCQYFSEENMPWTKSECKIEEWADL